MCVSLKQEIGTKKVMETSTAMMLVNFIIICCILLKIEAKLPPAQCIKGEFHRAKPGQETNSYQACHLYRNKTCCTAQFTQQLSRSPITKIGNFSWQTCGTFSKKCEVFMREIECFYQCSPNVAYWAGSSTATYFSGVPLCSTFCDQWYEACKSEKACAKNWITDFNKNSYGENTCKPSSSCQDFSIVYGSGKALCESMWGGSFVYKVSKSQNDCMHLNSSNSDLIAMNTKVAAKYKSISSAVRIGSLGYLIVSSLLLVLSGLVV